MLILIAGLPATGKTVHARMLAAALNAQHLNSDRMREIMGLRGHYQPADKQAVYDALLEAGKEALQHGSKVVIDSTFYRESGRVPFREMAQSSGAPLFWITIRADETTIRKRLLIPRPDSEADWDVYTRLRDASEPLNDPHLELWSDRLTVEEMLLMSLLHLKNARV
jgi:predicted kinase